MLYYIGLEPYEERYTLQLTEWNAREFKRLKIPYTVVEGKRLVDNGEIKLGQVLDAHGRCYYALSQIQELIKLFYAGAIKGTDDIFFEDMFHPGFESLRYIMDQMFRADCPNIYMRCLAQTIDPDDFTNGLGMEPWMRKYEQMVDNSKVSIFCASEEMVANIRVAGWKSDCIVTGLPFGKEEVIEHAGYPVELFPFEHRTNRVVFASRFDEEKQPEFFIQLAYLYHAYFGPTTEFAFLSGGSIKSNDSMIINRLNKAMKDGAIKIYDKLSKKDYYGYLLDSKVLFNCALQDWVSNTVSEADTLGCNVLFPAYRSFPETFGFDEERLYVPWSLEDARLKLNNLLKAPHRNQGLISDYQNKTIERTLAAMGYARKGMKLPPEWYMYEERKKYRKNIVNNKLPTRW